MRIGFGELGLRQKRLRLAREMLELPKVEPKNLNCMFELCIKHLELNLRRAHNEEDNTDCLLRLWLSLMRSYPLNCEPSHVSSQLLSLYSAHRDDLQAYDPIRFLEISEEYMISGLMQLSASDVTHIF